MISLIAEMKRKFGIEISEGENFKQALYNNNLADSKEELRDKIELTAKHHPGQVILLSTYDLDDEGKLVCAVVVPLNWEV